MSSRKQRWDERYQEKQAAECLPAAVLLEHASLLPESGEALELASGLGANSIYLARAGFAVTAIDYSDVALSKLSDYAAKHKLPIRVVCEDLESAGFRLPPSDIIIVSNYLFRPLFPAIITALNPGGLLYYQTFYGKYKGRGPEKESFRLSPGELQRLCKGLDVLHFREDENGDASIVARKKTDESVNQK